MVTKFFRSSNFSDFLGIKSGINQFGRTLVGLKSENQKTRIYEAQNFCVGVIFGAKEENHIFFQNSNFLFLSESDLGPTTVLTWLGNDDVIILLMIIQDIPLIVKVELFVGVVPNFLLWLFFAFCNVYDAKWTVKWFWTWTSHDWSRGRTRAGHVSEGPVGRGLDGEQDRIINEPHILECRWANVKSRYKWCIGRHENDWHENPKFGWKIQNFKMKYEILNFGWKLQKLSMKIQVLDENSKKLTWNIKIQISDENSKS